MTSADYTLFCESTTDLPASFFVKNNVEYVPFHFLLDGELYPDDLGQTMSFEEFYQRVQAGAMPTTSAINTGEYVEAWTPFLEQGKDILHISFSSGLSSSCETAIETAKMMEAQFPGRTIRVVDSLAASSGYGLLVAHAVQLRDSGYSLTQLAQWVEENRLYVHHWFFSTDLSSYLRGGRISKTSAFVGTMLNICPLLNMNDEGKLIPRAKIRSKKKAIPAIVERMVEHAKGGTSYDGLCFISNSQCYEDARAVADIIEDTFPHVQKPILINSIGTVIGSHTGVGTVALFFEGDKRTN